MTDNGIVFDVLTHHQYNGGDTAIGRFNKLQTFYNNAVAKGYGGKEFWITETGWSVDNSKGNVADSMQGMLDLMLANTWWKKTFWFAWRDNNTDMSENCQMIHLTTDAPYPHYYTFKKYTNPPHVTVLSPNGGEQWQSGTKKTITWDSSFVTAVTIDLLKAGIPNTTIASNIDATSGSYKWSIPSTLAGGADYQIRICNTNPSKVLMDTSNANFTIVKPVTSVSIDLGKTDSERGINRPRTEPGDGVTLPVTIVKADGTQTNLRQNKQGTSHYFYFCVDDGFILNGKGPGSWTKIRVRVQYWDRNDASWSPTMTLQYDAPSGSYTKGGAVTVGNTKVMKSVDFIIDKANAYFGNRQNGKADFRLACGSGNSLKYINTVYIYKE